MQIAFCIFKCFPHGGITRDLMKIVRVCQDRGHQVRIYAGRWEAELLSGVDLIEVPASGLSNHVRYQRYAAWVHAHLRRHPVDLLVGMNKLPGLDAYYAGDSCFEEKARTQRGRLYRLTPRYRHFTRFERAVFDASLATEILTISDVEVPHFRRHYGTQAARFHPLPPGIERDRQAPVDPEAVRTACRAEQGVVEDEQILLFLGSGFKKKGLDRALLAFRALPPERRRSTWLFVVGQDKAGPFRRMAKRLGIDDRVRFFGGRDDVPAFLLAADGMVLPAYDENAGMVILESMIAGLPALVTENCGYAHYLQQAGAGLIAPLPFDQNAFNLQLLELLTSPQRPLWRGNGLAFAADDQIYRLAEVAVDHLQRFAAERRPVIAMVMLEHPADGARQRELLRAARACLGRGYRVRVYTPRWGGAKPADLEVVELPRRGLTSGRKQRRFSRWVREDLQWRPAVCVVGFDRLPGLDVYCEDRAAERAVELVEECLGARRVSA
ncbi:MAG: glycosyltransferase family 4 protein [Pseudomonadales bacterium]